MPLKFKLFRGSGCVKLLYCRYRLRIQPYSDLGYLVTKRGYLNSEKLTCGFAISACTFATYLTPLVTWYCDLPAIFFDDDTVQIH